MVRNMNLLRISALIAVLIGAALAGCNSQTSNPDNTPGAPATPVNSTTAAPGNSRSDDNMSRNHGPGNNGPGNNMPGNSGTGTNMPGNHMPNNNGTGNNMPGNHMPNNNGTGNTMPGKGMGGMGGNR